MAFEKFLDLSLLLLSILFLLTRLALPAWLLDPTLALAAVLILSLPLLFLLTWRGERLLDWIERLPLLPRLKSPTTAPRQHSGPTVPGRPWFLDQLRAALRSLTILRHPPLLLAALLWTLAIWVLGVLTNWLIFRAVGLPLSAWQAVFLLAVLMVGVAVPSTPGRIGVFHYLVVLSLGYFGIAQVPALACAVILHLVVMLPILLAGLISLPSTTASLTEKAHS